MNKKKKIISIAAICLLGVSTTYIAMEKTENKILATASKAKKIVKILSPTDLINGKQISTVTDAVKFLNRQGVRVKEANIIHFVAPTQEQKIYAPKGSILNGFKSTGVQTMTLQSGQQPTKPGWTKVGSIFLPTGLKKTVNIPTNAKLKDGSAVTSANVSTWLKENSIINSNVNSNLISNFVQGVKDTKTDVSANSSTLLSNGYKVVGTDATTWIDNPDTSMYLQANAADAVLKNESEQDYKNRMDLAHKSVRDFVCGQHYVMDGHTFPTKAEFDTYATPKIQAKVVKTIDAKVTNITLINKAIANRNYVSHSVEYLLSNAQESINIRGNFAKTLMGWYIENNKVPGLDLSDSKYKNIDWANGLPHFISDYLFQNPSGNYWRTALNVDQYGKVLGTPKVSDADAYLAKYEEAFAEFKKLVDKLPSSKPLDDLKSELNNMFVTSNGNFQTLTEAYNAYRQNGGSTFEVHENNASGKLVKTFNTNKEAQDWINSNSSQQLFALQINGQNISINGKTQFTQAQKDAIIASHNLFEVNGVYYETKADADAAVLKQYHDDAEAKIMKFSNIDAADKTKFINQVANATTLAQINQILSDANNLNEDEKPFSVFAKADSSHSTPLNGTTQITSYKGLMNTLDGLVVQASVTTSVAVSASTGASLSYKYTADLQTHLQNVLHLPTNVLNATYNTKQDAINALLPYIVLVDSDGNPVTIDQINQKLIKQHTNQAPVISSITVNNVSSTLTPVGINQTYAIVSHPGANFNIREKNNGLGISGNNMWTTANHEYMSNTGFIINDGTKFRSGTEDEVAKFLQNTPEISSYDQNTASSITTQEYELEGVISDVKQDVLDLVAQKHLESSCTAKVAPKIHPYIYEKIQNSSVDVPLGNIIDVYEREEFIKSAMSGRVAYHLPAAPAIMPLPTGQKVTTTQTPAITPTTVINQTQTLQQNPIQIDKKTNSDINNHAPAQNVSTKPGKKQSVLKPNTTKMETPSEKSPSTFVRGTSKNSNEKEALVFGAIASTGLVLSAPSFFKRWRKRK